MFGVTGGMRHRCLLAGLLLALMSIPFPAFADKRIALVIGNGAYVKVPRLPNPTNDSAAMAGLLRKAGFDIVEEKTDLRADAMRRVLRDLSEHVRDADIAVVFYAGHGMEMNGVNYLIPVDATLARDVDVEDEAVSLDRVIRTIEPVRRLQLVILDACRDNPFLRSMRRTVVSRSVRSGHGDIDEKTLPPNTLIAYAQKAGATADDGTGSNSPYTTALLKHLSTPGVDVELALRRVRDDVLQATRNRQEPFKYGSLGGAELPLVPAAASPQASLPTAASAIPLKLSEAAEAWDRTKDTTSTAALEAFIARYKDTYYAELARLRIEELKKQQKSAEPAPVPGASEAAREWARVDKSDIAELDTFLRRHGSSPEADYARARVEAIKKQKVAIAAPPPQSSVPVPAGSNWVKLCDKTDCRTSHERLDKNGGKLVVSAAVRQVTGQQDQDFMVAVPLGMLLRPGMRAALYPKDEWEKVQKNEKVDESKLRGIALSYSQCPPVGCIATTKMTPDLLNDLRIAGGLIVFAINASGSPVSFPVSLNGFDAAYEGAPTDNVTYANARAAFTQQLGGATEPMPFAAYIPPQPPPLAALLRIPVPVADWVKLCEKVTTATKDKGSEEQKKEFCLTTHERLDSKTGNILITAAVRQAEGEGKQYFMAMVPLGVLQARGLQATIYMKDAWQKLLNGQKLDNNGQTIHMTFTLCHLAGCTAEIEASPEFLRLLSTAGGIVIAATNPNGQPMVYSVPLAGFDLAYSGAPMNNATYGAARRNFLQSLSKAN